MIRWLDQPTFDAVVEVARETGLQEPTTRVALLVGLDDRFTSMLPINPVSTNQFIGDLGTLNRTGRLVDGVLPIERWLTNAIRQIRVFEQVKILQAALDMVRRKADPSGPALDLPTLAETKEKIVHDNDLIAFGFLSTGKRVGDAVALLRVPRYEGGARALSDGNPRGVIGTGWLLASDLLLTNHHVINARDPGEQDASPADFELQAKNTVVQFDFNSPDSITVDSSVAECIAADQALDYAALRLAAVPPGRNALALRKTPISKDPATYPAVNIIQHPQGQPKQIAIRNNVVSSTTDTLVRYFSDTMPGSSGSPVCDDEWRVVALHHGSVLATNVSYQGRDVAWLNQGTHIGKILDDLRARRPDMNTVWSALSAGP